MKNNLRDYKKPNKRKFFAKCVLVFFALMMTGAMNNPVTWIEKMFLPQNNFPNPGFESSITTGVCAGDSSGAAPTTDQSCSSSPSLTLSKETGSSNVLNGVVSLKVVKAAANRQGEFIALDFNIENSQKNNSNTLSFEIAASSNFVFGTPDGVTPGDIRVFIADKTTNTVLAPYPNNIGSNGKYVGQWQASSNTSYQLLLWIPTTTTLAWDVYLDSFKNSLSDWVVVNSDSDWVSYTPAAAQQGFGTTTAVTARYRKQGPNAMFQIAFTSGTVAASEARFDLPTGMTASSSLPAKQLVGMFISNGTADHLTVLMAQSGTYFTFGQGGSSGNGYTNRNGNVVSATGAINTFNATVPIQGWTSGNAVLGAIYQNAPSEMFATKTSGSTTANNPIAGWTEAEDTSGGFNPTTGVFTVVQPGDYLVTAVYHTTATNVGNINISKNGTGVWYNVGGNFTRAQVTGKLYGLVPGDQITIVPSSTLTSSTDTVLSISKLNTPNSFLTVNRSTTKYLASTLSSGATDIASLRFSNLIVGKRYVLKIRARTQTDTSSVLECFHNGSTVGSMRFAMGSSIAGAPAFTSESPPFIATTTTVTTNWTETGTSSLTGDGTLLNTYITLVELNNEVEGGF